MKKTKREGDDLEKMEYTQARKELDRILADLEEGRIDIDRLAQAVERASTLIRHCRVRLEEQEARVKEITADLAGAEEAGEKGEE